MGIFTKLILSSVTIGIIVFESPARQTYKDLESGLGAKAGLDKHIFNQKSQKIESLYNSLSEDAKEKAKKQFYDDVQQRIKEYMK